MESGMYYFLLPDFKNIQFLIDDNQRFSFSTTKEQLIYGMQIPGHTTNSLLNEGLKIQQVIDSLQNISKTVTSKGPAPEVSTLLNQWIEKRNTHLADCQSRYPKEFYTIFKMAGQNPPVRDVKKANGTIDSLRQYMLYRAEFWDNVNLVDERLLRTPVLFNKLRRYMTELVPQQPDSIIAQADRIVRKAEGNDKVYQFVTNWIALNYQPTKTTVMDGEAVYVHIIDTYFNEKTKHWFKEGELEKLKKRTSEMRGSLLNRKGPDVISTDPTGKQKSIYGIRSPYVLVYMFSPNCEHCKKETPKMRAFYQEWKNKGVEVFAIAIDTKDAEWKSYIRENRIEDWINVYDPTNKSIYGKYFVDITPEIYLLNPDRTIIGKNLKTEQIAEVIRRDQDKRSGKK
jgi:thiol-disulfide isomerase/thioredoxin